jgi:Putative peptidoglycan binding domain
MSCTRVLRCFETSSLAPTGMILMAGGLLTLWLLWGLPSAAEAPQTALGEAERQHLQIIQATLARLGWYQGPIDGHPSLALSEALKRWMQAHGISVEEPIGDFFFYDELPQIVRLRLEAMYLAQGLTRPVRAGKKFPRDREVTMTLILTRLTQLGLYQGPIQGGPLTPAMEAALQRYMRLRGIPTIPKAPYALAVARLIDESLYSKLVEHPAAPPKNTPPLGSREQ